MSIMDVRLFELTIKGERLDEINAEEALTISTTTLYQVKCQDGKD